MIEHERAVERKTQELEDERAKWEGKIKKIISERDVDILIIFLQLKYNIC